MRNGGYKGILDKTTSDSSTFGIHNVRDQFEISKRFGGSWLSSAVPIYLDDTVVTTNGTVNADGSISDFSLNTSGGTSNRVWSTKLRNDGSGKFYFEIELLTGAGIYLMIGPAHQTATSASQTYNITDINVHYMSNGNLYPGNTATGVGTFRDEPEIIRIAYDMGAGKFWFNANDTWSSQTGDPDASGAGLSLYGYSTYGDDGNYRVLFAHGSSSNLEYTGNFLVGADLNYSPPTGFVSH